MKAEAYDGAIKSLSYKVPKGVRDGPESGPTDHEIFNDPTNPDAVPVKIDRSKQRPRDETLAQVLALTLKHPKPRKKHKRRLIDRLIHR